VQEEKGLDQVRRDWCPLSKEAGRFALRHILSGAPPEEVVQAIHDNLRAVRGPGSPLTWHVQVARSTNAQASHVCYFS
jgi:DNA polymerase elongation subunit (family B)